MINPGAVWLDQPVVHDPNLVTSRGPQDMVPFVRAMLDHFAGSTAPRATAARAHLLARAGPAAPRRDHRCGLYLAAQQLASRRDRVASRFVTTRPAVERVR